MNKQRFIKILKDYNNIPDDDRNKLHDLAKNYPYSQVIHTLVAKANNDARTPIAEQTLHYAAFYATDRHVLKEVIQEKRSVVREETVATPIKREVDSTVEKTETQHAPSDTSAPETASARFTVSPELYQADTENIRDAVLLDLENLRKSKASYMESLVDDSPAKEIKPATKEPDVKAPVKEQQAEAENAKTPAKKSPASKKKKEAAATDDVKKVKPEKKKPKTAAKKKKEEKEKKEAKERKDTKEKKKKDPEKKATDKKIKATGKLKKLPHDEQKEIIENFINKEPSITAKPLKSSENQPDLSEASTSFNEDLISENLAQILISQGKKNKAIDIYKKLIWKFPQKKAYFASRIEELQKQ